MEEELRLSLLLIGSVFIIGILAHGMWNVRKNNQRKKPNRVEPKGWEQQNDAEYDDYDEHAERDDREVLQDDETSHTADEYDELGVGKVRVVESGQVASNADEAEDDTDATTIEPSSLDDEPQEPEKETIKLYGSVVSNPKPHMVSQRSHVTKVDAPVAETVPEPPEFLLKTEPEAVPSQLDQAREQAPDFALDSEAMAPIQVEENQDNATSAGEVQPEKRGTLRRKTKSAPRRRQEPNFGDDEQMRIDFDPSSEVSENARIADQPQDTPSSTPSPASGNVEQEVLVLNVRVPDEEPISGAALLPMLLTLGFKFGDQDIFHRHANLNGKGPVLFSLANMFKPGVFDIDNLETFTTQGVSLFMLLPIDGDPHQVFNMMHNAARKLADEFSGQVLDGRRSVLTKQGLQQYVEKIREFERKRMIARH